MLYGYQKLNWKSTANVAAVEQAKKEHGIVGEVFCTYDGRRIKPFQKPVFQVPLKMQRMAQADYIHARNKRTTEIEKTKLVPFYLESQTEEP